MGNSHSTFLLFAVLGARGSWCSFRVVQPSTVSSLSGDCNRLVLQLPSAGGSAFLLESEEALQDSVLSG